jgi:hypothetical protein
MAHTDTEHRCNDLYAELGAVFHCEKQPEHDGDHTAIGGKVTWPQHDDSGARWVVRHPGAFLWHRIETRSRTACGATIDNLTLTTFRGRTLGKPPTDAHVCSSCLSVAPWVPVDGALAPAA